MTYRRALAVAAGMGVALATAATASGAEVRQRDWSPVSIAYTKGALVAGWTSVARFPEYTIWRADTMRLPLAGHTLRGTRQAMVAVRTSAGPTRSAEVSGDGTARHLLIVRGRGFLPQVISCCRQNGKDYPVETTGRSDGPTTRAAVLDDKVVRYVTTDPTGVTQVRTRHIAEGVGEPFGMLTVQALDARPTTGMLAIAPGVIVWNDERSPTELRTATIPAGGGDPVSGPAIALPGTLRRLQVATGAILVVVEIDGRFRMIRFDAPDWQPTTVWTGNVAPGPSAVIGGTVVFAVGRSLRLSIPNSPATVIRRLRVPPVAVATDAVRVAAAERLTFSGRRFTVYSSVALPVTEVTP